jgi:hypothetical protein
MEPGEAKGIQTGFSAGKKTFDTGSNAPAQVHESRKRDGLNTASASTETEPASGLGFELVPVSAPEIAASRAALPPMRRGDFRETFSTEPRGARQSGHSTAAVDSQAVAKGVGPVDDIAGITSPDANGAEILNGKVSATASGDVHKPDSIEAVSNPGRVEPGQYLNDALQARQPAHAAVTDATIANAATGTSTDSRLAGNAAPPAEHRIALRNARAAESLPGERPAHTRMGAESAGERGFSSIAAQDAPGPILVRDPGGIAGPRGIQAGSFDVTHAGGNQAHGLTDDETFTRLDSEGGSRSIHWVQAGAHRAEAGYLDPALGWVAVRAESSGGGLHAAVLPGSPEAAQVLSTHLGGLNAFLAQQHGPHATATMAAPGDGQHGATADQGNSTGGGSGKDDGTAKNMAQAHRESVSSPGTGAARVADKSPDESAIRRAGTYVSVMA